MANPKVSILCLSYNQSKYIRQALDSFLMQKTDFEFEVLINDDASTDGTKEIIEEYQKKHPKIIKPIFHDKNLYSNGMRNMIARFLLPLAKGKYLALCEGDDFWIDPQKLQLQVNYLEANPDYSICFHPVRVFFEKKEKKEFIYPEEATHPKFNINYLLRHNFIQTNSVMYRRQEYTEMPTDITPSDWFLHLYYAQFGKIGFINKVMSAYRIHPGGIWYNSYNNLDEIIKVHGLKQLNMQFELLKIYGSKNVYKTIIYNTIRRLMSLMVDVDEKYKTHNVEQLIRNSPDYTKLILTNDTKELHRKQDLMDEKDKTIYALHHQIESKDKELENRHHQIESKDKELEKIKSSRVWILRNKLAKLSGKEVI